MSSTSKVSPTLFDEENDFSENVQNLEERYLKNEEENHKRCLENLEQQIRLLGEENLNLRTTLFDLKEAQKRKKAEMEEERGRKKNRNSERYSAPVITSRPPGDRCYGCNQTLPEDKAIQEMLLNTQGFIRPQEPVAFRKPKAKKEKRRTML
ncbi:Oidioi.mRNA.OKI2018_I69.chr2.g5845.t1.cds [Oikopleura dioica]|uniref:Oidioi.mRNA.OKI2018_I69.chr2.g5845.t1.cds n=1 Tax=Oikopleura dioica TaxID=34765 RepID=A0ABN7T125_OIKDI|nr:Oidioi.mRNA.OKI2018_I69.chr2.g5845.t1.cds [Oikopleura dioica]